MALWHFIFSITLENDFFLLLKKSTLFILYMCGLIPRE